MNLMWVVAMIATIASLITLEVIIFNQFQFVMLINHDPLPEPLHSNIIPVSFHWRDLSAKELKEWYRPIDICMLKSNTSSVSMKSHFANHCNGVRSHGRLDMNFCGPGMGSRGHCPSPLRNREYFFKALQGYDDAQAKPLLHLTKSLKTYMQELIFIGDSLMRQNVLAFLCELKRERIVVHTAHADDNCHHIYNIRDVRVLFLQVGKLYSVDNRCSTNEGGRNRTGPGSFSYAKAIVRQRQLEVLACYTFL